MAKKRIFNIANYKDNSERKFGMLCKTEDEAKTFCNYLDSLGRQWSSAIPYSIKTCWDGKPMIYYFNRNTYEPSRALIGESDDIILTFSDFDPVSWLGVLIGLLVAYIIIYIKFDGFDNELDKKNALVVWSGIFATALILLIADICFSKTDAIQCTIEDNVSINEVYDNYDVIDKQGEIWTLKEKTNENT